jgi:hypothetical protein
MSRSVLDQWQCGGWHSSIASNLGTLLIWFLSRYEALLLFLEEASLSETQPFLYTDPLQASPIQKSLVLLSLLPLFSFSDVS